MAFATLHDGTRLYYEEQGSGEPLVLISGQRTDHFMWLPVLADFTRHYHVITFDHRGTGQSDKPASPPYTTRGMAGDIAGLLDHLGIDRAHVYGISMGGRIAQWFGIDYGERLGALALGCTTSGGTNSVSRSPEIEAIFLNETKEPAAIRQRLELAYTPSWLDRHPGLINYSLNEADLLPPHSAVLHLQASSGHDAYDELHRITAPTLVNMEATTSSIQPPTLIY